MQEWRGWWKATVKEIRYHKRNKRWHRNTGRFWKKKYGSSEYPAVKDAYIKLEVHYLQRERLRHQASYLLDLRKEGKKLSWAEKQKTAE